MAGCGVANGLLLHRRHQPVKVEVRVTSASHADDGPALEGADMAVPKVSRPSVTAAAPDDPDRPLDLPAASEHVAALALRSSSPGLVGFELESHLVDLSRPGVRVDWTRSNDVVRALPALTGGSAVTFEPGGQLELSTPPAPDTTTAVRALRADYGTVRLALADEGLGLACLGTDPARPSQRVSPDPRYVAMEQHFRALGQADAGLTTMCSTASLQVNLEAGSHHQWVGRLAQAHRLGPVLIAISACSSLLSGRPTGWRSTRQRLWGALDRSRCGSLAGTDDPAQEWSRYAMRAPVMFVRDTTGGSGAGLDPVLGRVPFGDWSSGRVHLGDRRPVLADLELHLSTLFPPTRLRGFLELRLMDAVPTRWWPGLAATATLLMDDAGAAQTAADACAPTAECWDAAARHGLAHPALARAASRCMDAALAACPAPLRPDVEALAGLVATGRSPGDLVAARAREVGPLALLEETAHLDAGTQEELRA